MNKLLKHFLPFLLLSTIVSTSFSQSIIENYQPAKKDSVRIGKGDADFLPLIQSGYTLMLPTNKTTKGVLILLEDSGYDNKNNNAKQLYMLANKNDFAVLSISTEIPFDFFFLESSLLTTHTFIQEVFTKHQLPNDNIFFLGASLVGHRAMRYVKFMKENTHDFSLNIKGLVLCNFTMDWTRKWHQHERDISINKIHLWEPTFINYMLETYLKGTPKTNPEAYHDFSSYSYVDDSNRNIKLYKDYAVRTYIKPNINYRLETYYRTLYENNATDMVGFIAELRLAGNNNTELIVLQEKENVAQKKNAPSTWNAIDKNELMEWILKQTEK